MIKQSSLLWIGWIQEVPGVNFQEPTRPELIESFKVTRQEGLEFNRQEVREASGQDFEEASLQYETRRASSAFAKQWLNAAS